MAKRKAKGGYNQSRPTERKRGKMSRRVRDPRCDEVATVRGFVNKLQQGRLRTGGNQMSKRLLNDMIHSKKKSAFKDDPTGHTNADLNRCSESSRLKLAIRVASTYKRRGAREIYGMPKDAWRRMVKRAKRGAQEVHGKTQPSAKEKRLQKITGLPYSQVREMIAAQK